MHKMHNAHHIHQEHASQQVRTLGSQPRHLVIFIYKDTTAPGSVDTSWQMLNFELYIYFVMVQSGLVQNMPNLKIFSVTVIIVEYC